MIDETRQDQAALYVLRMLPPVEALHFAQEMETDAELRDLVGELECSAAAVAHAAPLVAPPPELKERVMDSIRRDQRVVPMPTRIAWIPWALAACAALTTSALWFENESLRRQGREMQGELARLRDRDELSTMRIATLAAKVSAYEKALAVVVYDAKSQRGLLKVDGFPPAAAGKDYQLWVIEPGGAAPVSAGVVPLGGAGATRVAFRPERKVTKADAFAISVEQAGGAAAPKGEIVFVGN